MLLILSWAKLLTWLISPSEHGTEINYSNKKETVLLRQPLSNS